MPAIVEPKHWGPFFPFSECRPIQAEALDFIVNKFLQYDDIFLEAPTGVGKSAIAIAIARWRASLDQKTYITTTKVELEDQYIKDFYLFGLRQLHSKGRYPCDEFQHCDLGFAAQCQSEICAYRLAKEAFLSSSISICNSAYLLTCARHLKTWPTRDLLIVDEAHALHETIAGEYAISISRRDMQHMPDEGDEVDWLQEEYAPQLADQIGELEEQLQEIEQDDPRLESIVEQLETANRKFHNIAKLLSDDSSDWVFDHQGNRLNILPLWGRQFAQELLPRIGRKRLYLSATLAGAERQARYLGIDPARAPFLSLPSPFPVENRYIWVSPLVRWPGKGADIAPAIEQLCHLLPRILLRHPGERGIVFVSSYDQAQALVAGMRDPRLLTHNDSQDKAEVMARFHSTPGAVLVSPTSHEGLDLYDDLSRFQVIAKLPFAGMGDKRVKRRMATDPVWYTLHTAQKLAQACGRSIRSVDDFAVTYIIDAAFPDFFKGQPRMLFRDGAHRVLPKFFMESLVTGITI